MLGWFWVMAARIRGWLWRRRENEEFARELESHLEMLTAENVRRGMATEEARRAARVRLGGMTQISETHREMHTLPVLETFVQDIRYGLRTLRKSPGFTMLTVLILGLGIGANTAAFSVVKAVILRPLPYRAPGRLAMLWVMDTRSPNFAVGDGSTSYADFLEWQRQAHAFQDLAIFYKRGWSVVTLTGDEPKMVQGAFVSSNFFPLMGIAPILGRTFTEKDLQRREHFVVLSYGLWQSRFGGSPEALGSKLAIDGSPWQVVGVMPPQFRFPFLAGNWENHAASEVQLWAPLTVNPSDQLSGSDPLNITHPQRHFRFQVVVRLKPGVSIRTAQTEMETIAARLAREYPDTNKTLSIRVRPLDEYVSGEARRPLLLLSACVLLVLLIACTNLATLFLARGVSRAKELAVRAAIGATRWRVIRQLLTESALVGLIGGTAGVLVAGPVVHLIIASSPVSIPRLDETHIDAAVLAFSFLLALTCSLGFGLAPARRFSRCDANELLKTGQQSSAKSTLGLQGLLIGAQFALSLVLLTSAGLLIRSFVNVLETAPGFQPDHILTTRMLFTNADAVPSGRMADYYRRVLERVRRIPGVQAAGTADNIFFLDENKNHALREVEGHPPEPVSSWTPLAWTGISGDYFRAMGIPLLEGRTFTEQDGPDAAPVAIINETLAKRYWPGEDPIGKRLKGFDPRGKHDDWVTVVGLVADMRSHGLERAPMAEIYEVQAQSGEATPNLVVRTSSDPVLLAQSVRATLRSIDKSVILSRMTTMQDVLQEQTAARRFQAWLMGLFSGLALLLAAAGVYGVMHYLVTERIPEIGVRMAFGARGDDIVALLLSRAARFTGAGLAAGLVLAFWSASLIKKMLFGVTSTDPPSFLMALALLVLAALVATYFPARKATKVDPMVALRYE